MKMSREDKGDVAILRLEGNLLGGSDAETMQQAIHKVVADGKRNVLLDLEKVPLANSTGLGILVTSLTTIRRQDGSLKLLNVPKRIGSALQMTWLTRVFELFKNEDEALASFKS